MEITEVKVFLVNEEKLKAFVSVVIDQCFMINDIKVIQGRDGLFISMPSRRKKNGEFKDVAHPLNNETRRWMESRILSEYERIRQQRGEAPRVAPRPEGQARSEAPVRPASQVRPEDPEPGSPSPPPVEPTPAPASMPETSEKTLEEVQEQHLNDSFWTVT